MIFNLYALHKNIGSKLLYKSVLRLVDILFENL